CRARSRTRPASRAPECGCPSRRPPGRGARARGRPRRGGCCRCRSRTAGCRAGGRKPRSPGGPPAPPPPAARRGGARTPPPPPPLLLQRPSGEVAAQVVEEDAVDLGDHDLARLDRGAPAGPGEDLLDEVHASSRGSVITPRTAVAAAMAGLPR